MSSGSRILAAEEEISVPGIQLQLLQTAAMLYVPQQAP
jgi:hypothetical protein